jgi:Probable lipoprotein LpqN
MSASGDATVRLRAIAAIALVASLMTVACARTVGGTATRSTAGLDASPTATTKPGSTSPRRTSKPSAPPSAGRNPTIADYVQDNDIVETGVHEGDPGTPTLDLPMPAGWEKTTTAPPWAWEEIVYGASSTSDPASITVLMSRLTGDVDPAKILEYAPGELRNLPGFRGMDDGVASTLSGFDAFQMGGSFRKNGMTRVIAQKTVVIPAKDGDGIFVLQLNADGAEDDLGALSTATSEIDANTTITP